MTQLIAALSIDRGFLDQVDLVSLIEQKSPTRFGRASGNGTKRTVKGPCPWCGGADRFAVFTNETPQRYYCGIHGNGCRKYGDAIQFLRDYEGKSFREAVSELTGEDMPMVARVDTSQTQMNYGTWQRQAESVVLNAEKQLWNGSDIGDAVLTYLVGRGFTEETIKNARLGAHLYKGAVIAREEQAPVPCLVIPWLDRKDARYWRVEYRDTRPDTPSKYRYESLKGSSVSDGIYGSQIFKRPVFLTEGAIDALSIAQEAGDLVAVVATGSTGGSHNPKWLMKLAMAPRVFVAFDSEEKGERAARYWLDALPNAIRWRTSGGKDANEMLQHGGNVRLWVEAALATLELPELVETPEASSLPLCAVCGAIYDGYYGDRWLCGRHYDEVQNHEQVLVSEVGEQTPWGLIRAVRGQAGIPRWLIPGTDEWNKQLARNGSRELLERRRAWFDQQKRPQDVGWQVSSNPPANPTIVSI
jgi:DNA primase